MAAPSERMPAWAWLLPLLGLGMFGLGFAVKLTGVLVAPAAIALVAAVFAGVYHAEVVAHRVGEPFGTLVLAIAVTIIEVMLIVSVMLGVGEGTEALARDTAFSAVMLVCNGIVGICLLAGGVRHHEQGFQVQGASAALAVLAALTVLTLVLPNFTTSVAGPVYSPDQLLFAGIASLVLYVAFVFVQTVRHRDYFLTQDGGVEDHVRPPSARAATISALLLVVALVAVIGLAKKLTPALEAGLDAAGAPKALVGVVIAAVVLLPEGLAALGAASANRLQTSLNLALGSALATIGLTIPAVVAVSLGFDLPVTLGLDGKGMVLLFLTLLVGVVTLGTGRTTVLQGVVHLVILAAFLFFTVIP